MMTVKQRQEAKAAIERLYREGTQEDLLHVLHILNVGRANIKRQHEIREEATIIAAFLTGYAAYMGYQKAVAQSLRHQLRGGR